MLKLWTFRLNILFQCVVFIASCGHFQPVTMNTRLCNSTDDLNVTVTDLEEPSASIKDKRDMFLLPIKGTSVTVYLLHI